jgi:hypothetical protein
LDEKFAVPTAVVNDFRGLKPPFGFNGLGELGTPISAGLFPATFLPFLFYR